MNDDEGCTNEDDIDDVTKITFDTRMKSEPPSSYHEGRGGFPPFLFFSFHTKSYTEHTTTKRQTNEPTKPKDHTDTTQTNTGTPTTLTEHTKYYVPAMFRDFAAATLRNLSRTSPWPLWSP